ncbi:MAG: Proposed peptidoglycan lipid II flippase MurJ [uncultured Sphingomonas sp.]|uniref:Probable lipid II flippase MurJ n=1 Tax=uncultured Sphingomonas sp. TaxID=158754 RepID=A0A6J4TBX5_9SPHN|nr:murein biosynthesis integral membrane protein MurJ [uncultured Sphingomonas sp.]CAA9519363.1 MAG: Proposed peptidoglycan lipid II flippase MurJ [uncultured Sphingomonas sp.]
MNLLKATGTIGGLTMVSRVLGFARDMIAARLLGASHANDAFNLAFLLPNIFRRLFAEGAFSAGFVPLFSRRLASGGMEEAQRFSNEILAVFMPALLLVTAVFVIFMPGVLMLVVPEYADTPGKLPLATELSRWTFPYLLFISLVALLSGVLNSLTRFAVAAFAPALLNLALIVALLLAPEQNNSQTVRFMAVAVLVGGLAQFAFCWFAVRRAGVKLRFGRPRLTPAVRELVILILPATAAAGLYQLSQLFYAYFSSRLGEGALTMLSYADRLNQLPLSIIGTALGVAILPAISQAIARNEEAEAADVQARAFDLSMLLTLPATLALMVAAFPIIGALYRGGEYSLEAAQTTANILAILVTGLPAYVLVKVLTPAFYARKDVKTPVYIAMSILALSIPANFLLIPLIGIYSLATVTSAGAWINFVLLFAILYRRGHFRMPAWLVSRVARQLLAALAMAAALFGLRTLLADWFLGNVLERAIGLALLVGIGGLTYFGVAFLIGGVDREALASLRRRRAPAE